MNEYKREIKFRAWDKKDKKMLNWDYIEDICGVGYILYNERITPMQYTGLKDKNGKEIYEGDVVKMITKDTEDDLYITTGIIEYLCPCFSLKIKYGMYNTIINYGDNIEILGNIYENPDLIKLT